MPRSAGVDERALNLIVDEVYETAALGDPDQWRDTLQNLSRACGAEGAVILTPAGSSIVPQWSESIDELIISGLKDNWLADNPRLVRSLQIIRGQRDIVTQERAFTPDELARQPYYNEYMARFGFHSYAGFALAPAGADSVYLSLERRSVQGAFSAREIETIQRVLPHLQRAGRIALNLGDARARGILDNLESLRRGGVLIGRGGRVVAVNSQAERHFATGEGLRLMADGKIVAQHRDADIGLQRLIGSVLEPPINLGFGPPPPVDDRDTIVVPRPPDADRPTRSPLLVHASPLVGKAGDFFRSARALVMIADPDEHRDPAEPVLIRAFGLTPAEVRVALALVSDQDVAQIAEAHNVREGTVRLQIKAIFAKTGVRRQSSLVALLQRFAFP